MDMIWKDTSVFIRSHRIYMEQKYREVINDNVVQAKASGPQTGLKVHLPTGQWPWAHSQDNTWGAYRGNSVNVLRWPTKGPEQNPIKHLWKDLKTIHRQNPCNLTEHERLCRDEWKKIPKYRWARLVVSFSRRLEAVTAAKCASTKY